MSGRVAVVEPLAVHTHYVEGWRRDHSEREVRPFPHGPMAVVACPWCAGEHVHSAVAGPHRAWCGRGSYIIAGHRPDSVTAANTL